MLQGDEQSLSILLSDYHNYLVVVGTRYLTDRQRVEDVIQDLFADLWNSKKDISITAGVKSFLRGAVVNKCLAIIRKDKKIDLVEEHNYNLSDRSASADQEMDGDHLKRTIDDIVNSLPAKCKEVFCLSRYDGKSHKEIADHMGISKKTIENHMTKALSTLRSELKRKELLVIIFMLIKISFVLGVYTQ